VKRLTLLAVCLILLMGAMPVGAATPPFKVAFLLADSPTDGGWNAAHGRGIDMVRALPGVQVMVIEKVGYAEADIERAMEGVVANGAQLVFGTWFDARNVMAAGAEKYPGVLFEHCSGYPLVKSNGRNFSTYFARMEQGDYIAGVIAAKHGCTSVGIVGTYAIPEPVRGLNWFTLGMQSVNPAATSKVVWINSWLDPNAETLAAGALVDAGYTCIRQMADTPYSSIEACRTPGVTAIGYGTDARAKAPCTLVTNEWNWGPYYVEQVRAAMAGTWVSQDWYGGVAEGAVKMVGDPAEYQPLVDKFTAGFNPACDVRGYENLSDGTKREHVVVGCQTDDDLLSMQWLVNGVDSAQPTIEK